MCVCVCVCVCVCTSVSVWKTGYYSFPLLISGSSGLRQRRRGKESETSAESPSSTATNDPLQQVGALSDMVHIELHCVLIVYRNSVDIVT